MRDLTERLEQKDGSTPDDLTNHIRAVLPGTAGSNTPHIRLKCRAVRGRRGSSRAGRPGQERRPASGPNPRDQPGSRRTSCKLRIALKLAEDRLHARRTRSFQQGIQEGRRKAKRRQIRRRTVCRVFTAFAELLCHIEPCLGSSHRALFQVGWTAPFGALWMPY